MALKNVPLSDCRVTGLEFFGYAILALQSGELAVANVFFLNLEAV
jgi:hypothetical protein